MAWQQLTQLKLGDNSHLNLATIIVGIMLMLLPVGILPAEFTEEKPKETSSERTGRELSLPSFQRYKTSGDSLSCNWTKVGCFKDSRNRLLKGPTALGMAVTHKRCLRYCARKQMLFAGLEHGAHCYCGNCLSTEPGPSDDSACNKSCRSYSEKTCGGHWYLELYTCERRAGKVHEPERTVCGKEDISEDTSLLQDSANRTNEVTTKELKSTTTSVLTKAKTSVSKQAKLAKSSSSENHTTNSSDKFTTTSSVTAGETSKATITLAITQATSLAVNSSFIGKVPITLDDLAHLTVDRRPSLAKELETQQRSLLANATVATTLPFTTTKSAAPSDITETTKRQEEAVILTFTTESSSTDLVTPTATLTSASVQTLAATGFPGDLIFDEQPPLSEVLNVSTITAHDASVSTTQSPLTSTTEHAPGAQPLEPVQTNQSVSNALPITEAAESTLEPTLSTQILPIPPSGIPQVRAPPSTSTANTTKTTELQTTTSSSQQPESSTTTGITPNTVDAIQVNRLVLVNDIQPPNRLQDGEVAIALSQDIISDTALLKKSQDDIAVTVPHPPTATPFSRLISARTVAPAPPPPSPFDDVVEK